MTTATAQGETPPHPIADNDSTDAFVLAEVAHAQRQPPMAPGQPVRPAPGGLLPPRPRAPGPNVTLVAHTRPITAVLLLRSLQR